MKCLAAAALAAVATGFKFPQTESDAMEAGFSNLFDADFAEGASPQLNLAGFGYGNTVDADENGDDPSAAAPAAGDEGDEVIEQQPEEDEDGGEEADPNVTTADPAIAEGTVDDANATDDSAKMQEEDEAEAEESVENEAEEEAGKIADGTSPSEMPEIKDGAESSTTEPAKL